MNATQSQWRCPDCHQPLTLRNSGYYYCLHCQKEHDGEKIDPMHRDHARNELIVAMAIEQAGLL